MTIRRNHEPDRHQQQRPAGPKTFAGHLVKVLGWESVYAYNEEIFGPVGTLAGASESDVVLMLHLRRILPTIEP